MGYLDERFIEYDLDEEDEAWLEKLNRGQDRLPARRMELLMWRLECANADATDRALAAAGAQNTRRQLNRTCMYTMPGFATLFLLSRLQEAPNPVKEHPQQHRALRAWFLELAECSCSMSRSRGCDESGWLLHSRLTC